MSLKTPPRSPVPAILLANKHVREVRDSRTVLLMRKQEGGAELEARWPYKDFNAYLNQLMVDAGIPLSDKSGMPNTMRFEEITGIDPARVSRWRSGKTQPTTQSLRQIAENLAPLIDLDASTLLAILEIKAGRRSEAEALVSGVDGSDPALQGFIRRALLMVADPALPEERRREIQASIIRAQAEARAARDIEKTAETRLREVLERSEPATDR
jgi:transcriptional regulator with XRE-family HTH domain